MKKVGSIVKKQNGELSIYHTKEVPYYITYFDDLHLDLLKIDECGWQAESFLEINEEQKNYYVIHYVVKGKGYFVVDGKKMIVGAYRGFILPPGKKVTYWYDREDPWQYYWVGVSGLLAKKLIESQQANSDEPYVFTSAYKIQIIEIFEKICDACSIKDRMVAQMRALSGMYELFSYLFCNDTTITTTTGKTDLSVEKIVGYIDENYQTVTVKELSSVFFVHRCNLFKMFKNEMDCSIIEYIISVRIKKAKGLLKVSSMSIKEVALSTGFKNAASFCAQFKNKTGLTPTQYRRTYL